MKDDLFFPAPGGCDAIQARLSDLADTGAALPAELRVHLASCAACARFAERWLPPPEELARPVPAAPGEEPLRARILDAAASPDIVPFPTSAARRLPWAAPLGRAAACLALAGFSYWLLNPVATPARKQAAPPSAPTLSQGLARMEGRTKREQLLLQTALVDGGRQVKGNVAWSVSALEL